MNKAKGSPEHIGEFDYTPCGIDTSQQRALKRQRNILEWVLSTLPKTRKEFGVFSDVPDNWQPRTKAEREEASYLRNILLATSAEDIVAACGCSSYIEGLESTERWLQQAPDEAKEQHEARTKKVKIIRVDDAFSILVEAFKLTPEEARLSRIIVDDQISGRKSRHLIRDDVSSVANVCAVKFNIIRKAVGKDEQIKRLSSRKPLVTFSDDFKTVNCTAWSKSESRERSRAADKIIRRLYENWRDNKNTPLSQQDLLVDIESDRLEKILNANKRFPQMWSLIRREFDNKTGNRSVCLNDEYEYRAT